MHYLTQPIYKIIFILVLTSCWFNGLAQPSEQNSASSKIQYGTDDLLSLGNPYRPVFRRAQGHQYFQYSEHDQNGITWVRGVPFKKVMVRYDLELDQVVGKLWLTDSSRVSLVFETQWLDSFELHQQHFINAQLFEIDGNTRDYLSRVHFGKDTFLLEYRKTFIDSYTKVTPYGRYSETGRRFLLISNHQLINISSRKKLYAQFPEKKDKIKNYLKTNQVKYRRASIAESRIIAAICEGN